MRKLVVVTAIFFSGLAVAQGLPKFGTANLVRLFSVRLLLALMRYPFPLCPYGQPSCSLSRCGLWPI